MHNCAVLVYNNISLSTLCEKILYYFLVLSSCIIKILVLNKFSDDVVDVLFIKTKYVKGRHFVVTNCCFVNSSQKRKQINRLISTDITLFRGILNILFDLLQNLNISSSNDPSLSLDTFSLITILFCEISFSTRIS